MKQEDKRNILGVIGNYIHSAAVQETKDYIQHGSISTYKHCINVVKLCYIINRKYNLRADEETLLVAALFHDLYLYDWHDGKPERIIHGYTHPHTAAEKAKKYFDISDQVYSCIETHMWPLTLLHIPRSKEAWILCIADKFSSIAETLWMR